MTQEKFEIIVQIKYLQTHFEEITIIRDLNNLMIIKQDKNIGFFKEVIKLCNSYVEELEQDQEQCNTQ